MTQTEHVGIAELFLDWKKKVAQNSKMKVFIEHFTQCNAEKLTPQMAKNILIVMQEQAREVLKEVDDGF